MGIDTGKPWTADHSLESVQVGWMDVHRELLTLTDQKNENFTLCARRNTAREPGIDEDWAALIIGAATWASSWRRMFRCLFETDQTFGRLPPGKKMCLA